MPTPSLWHPAAYALLALTAWTSAPALTSSTTPDPTTPDHTAPAHAALADATPAHAGFNLEAGKHELHDLLTKSAKILGRNYLMNDGGICGSNKTIELQKSMDLDAQGIEEVVSQIAYSMGYVIMPVDADRGLYEVISTHGPRNSELTSNAVQMTPDQVLAKRKLKVMVTTAYEFQHIDANRAAQSFRPFFARGGRDSIQFGPTGQPNVMMIQGYANQVASAIQLIKQADKPAKAAPNSDTGNQIENLMRRVRRLEAAVFKQPTKK